MAMISPAPRPNPFRAGPRNPNSPKICHSLAKHPSASPVALAGVGMLGLATGADALGHLLRALQAGGELPVGLFDVVLEGGQFTALQTRRRWAARRSSG